MLHNKRRLNILQILIVSLLVILIQSHPVSAETFTGQDSDGEEYSITIDGTDDATVGEITTLTISSFHEAGIYRVLVVEDGDYENKTDHNCQYSQTCEFSVDITQDYEGGMLLEVVLFKSPSKAAALVEVPVNFSCPNEYCSPNPLFNDFVTWMRTTGYTECLTSQYIEWGLDAKQKSIMKGFLEERPSGISHSYTVDFYDVVPTDAEATSLSLGAGEGGDCQYNPNWPDFCPEQMAADYVFLENHFRRTFGMDIQFNYIRLDISYADTFGAPTLIDNSYRFGSRSEFIQGFPDHSIIHYAIQTWSGLSVYDMTGGAIVCEVDYEPFNSLGAVTYTHEWGHTWGLPHPFYLDENNQRKLIQLDGIMSNTYYGSTALLDPLDPMERYALEPSDGYLDADSFASDYSNGIIGSWQMDICGFVDPAILGAEAVAETSDEVTVALELSNQGDILAGYVDLAVYDGISMDALIEERALWTMASGEQTMHAFTVAKSSITSGALLFVIDPQDEIAENEENNKILLVEDEGWHVLGNAEITLLVDRGNYIQVYYDIEGEYVDHYRLQWSMDSTFNTVTDEIPHVSGERGWINVMDYELEGPCKPYYFRIAPCGQAACGFWSETRSIVFGLDQCAGLDSDGDGIVDPIDTLPDEYSNDFEDGSSTYGSIMDRGDQSLTIIDELDPAGVRIIADSTGGATPATVVVCGGSAMITLSAEDQIVATCSSVEIGVMSGIVEITFVASDGTQAATSLEAGNELTFDPNAFTLTAASTNLSVAVVFVDGTKFYVAPGERIDFSEGGVETIVIDGCDTDVDDRVHNGRYISVWIDECAVAAKNHGKFVSCVAKLSNELKKAGVITGKEKGAIQSCAAHADIP